MHAHQFSDGVDPYVVTGNPEADYSGASVMKKIVQGDAEPVKTQINYTDNLGDWASLGGFDFDRNEEISIEIKGKNGNYPIVADAVLLTPSK